VGQREQQQLLALGRAVREIRGERGMGVAQLASAAGVDLRQIAALEAGRLNPAYELLLALAEVLGVPASELVVRAEALLAELEDSDGTAG
jgi:XRE family aerobic/anaerobic benzoate catabolism transcriptional regulator